MSTPRILLIDIETAPKIAYVWRTFKENISVEQIVSDTHLLSFAAKWLGEREIIYSDQSRSRQMSDDTRLLKQIHALLDEADIVIAHNGQAFDLPFVLTRMAAADIPPPSNFRQVDTYRVAKKQFGFTFNKLEFLAKALKCKVRKNPHKRFPGMELWKECLARNQEAWDEMRTYNIDDVRVLEEVYMKLRPWIEGHPNVGMYRNYDRPSCPVCGGTHMVRRKLYYTNTNIYPLYRCSDCGKYARGRKGEANPQHRKNQLMN
jgi:hypothetical protein